MNEKEYKTNILITIDTEFSIGGYFNNEENRPVPADRRIYCKIDGKEYGINLIMDILERYDLRGIFFMETESRFYFGDNEIISIIQNIRNRGHEVQLHIHPNFRSFKNGNRRPDDLRKYSLEAQSRIIREALAFLASHRINGILAYRSGGFYSDLNTIKALKENNIKYSSNYNLAFRNCDYIENHNLHNDIFCINDVFEVPITSFREFGAIKDWNCFQLSAASFNEIKEAACYYHQRQVNVITFLTHSFEFVKTVNVQSSKITPQHFLINRFDRICKYLMMNKDKYKVITFRELDNLVKEKEIIIREKKVDFYKSSASSTAGRYFKNYAFSKLNI